MGEGPSSRIDPAEHVIGGLYGDQPMTEHKEEVDRLILSSLEVADGREAAHQELFQEAFADNDFGPWLGGLS